MGELLTQLRKENMQAMKDKDTIKKGVLSLVISNINLAEHDAGKPLSKDEELTFVQKELKQTRETLGTIPSDRTELIEETNKKISILESYLPKQMSEDEIREAINKIIDDKGLEKTKKSQGIIMKEMLSTYKGKTDGKLVNKILSTILN